jgi:hypothetical protein
MLCCPSTSSVHFQWHPSKHLQLGPKSHVVCQSGSIVEQHGYRTCWQVLGCTLVYPEHCTNNTLRFPALSEDQTCNLEIKGQVMSRLSSHSSAKGKISQNPIQYNVMSWALNFRKNFNIKTYQNISKHQSLTIHHPSPDKVAGSCWVPNEPLPAAAGRTTKCFCSVGLGVPLKGSSSNDQAQENHQDIAVQIWDATTGNDSRNLESNRKGLLLHWGKFRESSLFTHVP